MAPTVPMEYTGQSKTGFDNMMGKKRKVSKGFSSRFVPDYGHAAETMAESEGLGSSGRVDADMTISEDSWARKRKCISVNGDGYDRFGGPLQVVPITKMSRSERKDMEQRLRNELEQVRILQRKLPSVGSDTMAAKSLSSDIRSSNDGHWRPVPENFNRPAKEMTMPVGKKKAPPERNGPRTKGAGTRLPESVKKAFPPSANNVMFMKQCESLLQRLMSHKFSWVFDKPVDVVKLNIPDYFTIIKQPMDLGTINRKLLSGKYSDPLGFAADVRLTFSNAMTYNPPGQDVHFMAKQLSNYFELRWKTIEKQIQMTLDTSIFPERKSHIESKSTTSVPPSKKMKSLPVENGFKQEPVKQVMTGAQKQKLSSELEELVAELPENIIDFLKESTYNSQANEDEIEIDIDALNDDTLFTLRKLLDAFISFKQKSLGKAEPCEIELHNESGFSNSSVQPCKCNDLGDEDVDIGGNDAPISSFPQVRIEKDGAGRNSNHSSSSSSSSDSGSSSSDSDTGTSSDGEFEGAKDQLPAHNEKEMTLSSAENLEQKRIDLGVNDTVSGDTINGQREQNSISKSDTEDPNGCPNGGSAPLERKVSPEKLYRAALLRSRFADTILKAQEKTHEKGEKLDPEKLRLEKEAQERRRREEKARLQAVARAAEEARKKAEVEAAAEAKRKRELEREAARQALEKMEKTVDIDDNSQFLEDLEMFGPSTEQSFMEETEPDDDKTGLGSFKFQASSNPLEQLGLFMKDEYDDEEEGEQQSLKDPSTEVEEGEID